LWEVEECEIDCRVDASTCVDDIEPVSISSEMRKGGTSAQAVLLLEACQNQILRRNVRLVRTFSPVTEDAISQPEILKDEGRVKSVPLKLWECSASKETYC